MLTVTIELSHEQQIALASAIVGGALAQRHEQLTELLRFNHAHASIANGLEREIQALTAAAEIIVKSL